MYSSRDFIFSEILRGKQGCIDMRIRDGKEEEKKYVILNTARSDVPPQIALLNVLF